MLNKVMLIGRLGAAPEIRYSQAGDPIANFNLATTETWTKEGTKHEKTTWHRIVVFGKLASICGDHLTKGSMIYCEGPLHIRQWEDKDEIQRYTAEITMRELKMLGGGATKKSKSEPKEKKETPKEKSEREAAEKDDPKS